jgi:transposase InsO family protein
MQVYHSNATTNIHNRGDINISPEKNSVLAERYNISESTVAKWKKRDSFEDKSSRPHTIHYSLSEVTNAIIVFVRKTFWSSLDELHEDIQQIDSSISRSAVYRTLARYGINKTPVEKRALSKTFKEYDPGYLHIDVTYLPKIEGKKHYLFVAIDRATRAIFYELYDAKTAENAASFLQECKDFFPFRIHTILTDNGLEFTNRLIKSKKGEFCKKDSLFDLECKKDENNSIEHRLTKPNTPKTNGMVERANGIIKSATVTNTTYSSVIEMKDDLTKFLIYYNLQRRHGSLKKELGVKTPLQAIEKWYELKPELFIKKPDEFRKIILSLENKITQKYRQPGET